MNNNKIKLLFVGAFPKNKNNYVHGGALSACTALIDAGLDKRFNLIPFDITQKTIPAPPIYIRILNFIPRLLKFIFLSVQKKPDAIIIFTTTSMSFIEKSYMVILGKLFGSYTMLFPRAGQLIEDCRGKKFYRWLLRVNFYFADVVLCQGEAWEKFFVEEMKFKKQKTIIVKNWTATENLLQLGRERVYSSEKIIRVLFLGWLTREKGVFELIEAFSLLNNKYSNLELMIAGEGADSKQARVLVKEKKIEENVSFLGWIYGNRKLQIFSDASIFCLPSHSEGLSNAMIEAMASGLPIVVTPVGAIPDVIVDRECGLITPLNDPQKLCNRLDELINDRQLRETLGRNAYIKAMSEFTAEKAVTKLEEIIRLGIRNRK